MDINELLSLGFISIGSWITHEDRPDHNSSLRPKPQPGLYAFSVGGNVAYIGMASALHSRLRNYGNRAFRNDGKIKTPRTVHEQIAHTTNNAHAVDVYVLLMPKSTRTERYHRENELRLHFRPAWDGLLGIE